GPQPLMTTSRSSMLMLQSWLTSPEQIVGGHVTQMPQPLTMASRSSMFTKPSAMTSAAHWAPQTWLPSRGPCQWIAEDFAARSWAWAAAANAAAKPAAAMERRRDDDGVCMTTSVQSNGSECADGRSWARPFPYESTRFGCHGRQEFAKLPVNFLPR